MAARNAEAFVAAAIESALGQTFSNFELVVVDDGSTDRTAEIVANYAAKDARIRLFRRAEAGGAAAAWNRGLHEARAEWIAVLDADDLWRPRRLELQLAAVDANPSLVLVGSEYDRMDSEGRLMENFRRAGPEWWLVWQLLYINIIGGHSQVMYRRESALACGGYRPECKLAEDYQLWVELAEKGGVACLPEVLMDYRVHDQSISSVNRQLQCVRAAEVSDRAICGLLGHECAPEQLEDLRSLLRASFPTVKGSLPQLARTLRNLRRAFWRRRPGLATMRNRLGLEYRVRRQWARHALYLFKAGRTWASFIAGFHGILR